MWLFSIQCDRLCLLLCKSCLSASDNLKFSTDPSCPSNDIINMVCSSSSFFWLIFKCWTWTQLYMNLPLAQISKPQCLPSPRMNARKKPSKGLIWYSSHCTLLSWLRAFPIRIVKWLRCMYWHINPKEMTTTTTIITFSVNRTWRKIEENHLNGMVNS